MRRYDWERGGIEHLERKGCIINIREGIKASDGGELTTIGIINNNGWELEGTLNNIIIRKKENKNKRKREE